MNPIRVLLIDDQNGFTRLLKISLERIGTYAVREENDSRRACAAAQEFRPDIIFCDIDMPNVDGGDVAAQIRRNPACTEIPIVFLTSLVGPEEAGLADSGFHFLAKPVELATLVRCIEEHARRTSGQMAEKA